MMFKTKGDRINSIQNVSHLDHRDLFANSVRLHFSWVGIAAKQENELQTSNANLNLTRFQMQILFLIYFKVQIFSPPAGLRRFVEILLKRLQSLPTPIHRPQAST